MSSQPVSAAPVNGSGESWDEARIQEALQRLKLLHVKERMLRDTVPKMIEPLIKKHPSPEGMFKEYMKAVSDAQANVKEFTEMMREGASKDIFEHAEKSQAADPNDIKPWRHKDHPDWFRLDSKDA